MMSTIAVTDKSFRSDVLESEKVVLVDFWAEWCGPCKSIAPVLEDIASQYEQKLTVAKIDIDENPETPGQYGVRGIPTLMLFKNGELAGTKVGSLPKSQLVSWIDGILDEKST